MDQIKEAFKKVKEDMKELSEQLSSLKKNFDEAKKEIISFCHILEIIHNKNSSLEIKTKEIDNKQRYTKNHLESIENKLEAREEQEKLIINNLKETTSALQHINQTLQHIISVLPTHNPAHNTPYKPLEAQNSYISTGNGGVPTDRQTDRQTDTSPLINAQKQPKKQPEIEMNSIEKASEILSSLDSIKKELRIKFKALTEQEIAVFSTIYQLEGENNNIDYKFLSQKLNLTESSIRDYVGRLIKKGVPIDKEKINNKTILLRISPNLRRIASLDTILRLREL